MQELLGKRRRFHQPTMKAGGDDGEMGIHTKTRVLYYKFWDNILLNGKGEAAGRLRDFAWLLAVGVCVRAFAFVPNIASIYVNIKNN